MENVQVYIMAPVSGTIIMCLALNQDKINLRYNDVIDYNPILSNGILSMPVKQLFSKILKCGIIDDNLWGINLWNISTILIAYCVIVIVS